MPKSIDSGTSGSKAGSLLIDAGLLVLFAVQHSVMARSGFKRLWTHIVPWDIERSTFVLFASLVLALVCWQWRPLPQSIRSIDDPIALFFAVATTGYIVVGIGSKSATSSRTSATGTGSTGRR